MDNKEQILDLYYNQHLKQVEIAKQLRISKQYISKIINTDSRNKKEKEYRKQQNSEKRSIYLKEYFQTYERAKKDDDAYNQMIALQKQDAFELSYYAGLSDYAFRKWNPSAYHTNSNDNLIIDKKLKIGCDVSKSINMNIKVPTQKYKNKYCFSH